MGDLSISMIIELRSFISHSRLKQLDPRYRDKSRFSALK